MITAYPQANKPKSLEICRAFVDGCGGSIVHHAEVLASGPAFFYGIDHSNAHLYQEARERGDYYYADNAYFDSARQSYFRVTKNRLQHFGTGQSDGERFAALGIEIKPWHDGEHIVLCPQSDHFMRTVAGCRGSWTNEVAGILKSCSSRPVVIREWNRDKTKLAATLDADLVSAHALVTWSSAASVTALLAGVPVIAMSAECAAAPMSGRMNDIERLPRNDRAPWAAVLADNQFTLAEMRSGYAWGVLHAA